ncbi:unnamed protein product [marine sediment metagenome]|uniref:Uncharacterized protein n=1 Tax=marine sediment metagenome TaxID=412755 RepID=X1JJE5_9ZZZZ
MGQNVIQSTAHLNPIVISSITSRSINHELKPFIKSWIKLTTYKNPQPGFSES